MGPILLSIRLGIPLLLACLVTFPSTTEASHLDYRDHHLWGEKGASIRRAADDERCDDGTVPIVTNVEIQGEHMAYSLICNDSGLRNSTQGITELDKRATSICSASTCSRECYHPADYNPDPKDCSHITSALRAEGGNTEVAIGETKVRQYNTCRYYLTNQSHDTISFCNSAWASIGDGIAWTCGRWLDDPAKGGICTTNSFYVRAVRTPDMPGPSYTIVQSTDTIVDLSPSTASNSLSTSSPASASGSSSSTSTVSGSQPSGSSSTGSAHSTIVSVIGSSTITFQDIPDLPSGSSDDPQNNTGNDASIAESSTSGIHTKSNTAVIVGATIGAIAVVALIIGVVFVLRRQKQQRARMEQTQRYSSYFPPADPTGAPRPWSIPSEGTVIDEKRALQSTAIRQTSDYGHGRNGSTSAPFSESTMTSTNDTPYSQDQQHTQPGQQPQPPYTPGAMAQLHPRSTEALIAAAAPANMSRDQIHQLTANFVSLVRGRNPQDEVDYEEESVREPPPYQGS